MLNNRSLYLMIFLISATDISAQWLDGYSYRKQISIQESQIPDGSDFKDFPVLINISFATDLKDEANGGYVNNSSGWDLVFTASNGTTLLDHDIEHYDGTSGEFVAWVKIPTLDHDNNTVIYLYFGNDTSLTDPTKSTTWSNEFVSVYHLHDDMLDASGSDNGTNFGSANADGRIADGQDFENDNSTDRIEIGNFDVSNDSITISAWIRPESFDNYEARIVSKATSSAEQDHYWMLATISDGTELRFRLRTGGNTATHFSGIGVLSTGSWQYVAAVYNGNNMNLFHNGSQVGTPLVKTGSINTDSSVDVAIGNQPASVSDWATEKKSFDGIIDEVRIISAARSSDWLAVEYNNISNPNSFYVVGAIEDNVPVASAGSDQDLCGILLATLDGNEPSIGVGTWTQISGPGTINFGNINIHNTSSTADAYGSYVLRWTIVNGTGSNHDEVVINYAEASVAGSDQDLCGGLVAILEGNAPTIGEGTWTKISGPGTITFGDINVNNTSATADMYGNYILRWTIDNEGNCSTIDDVIISYDAVDPEIICPGDLTTACNISEQPAYANYSVFFAAGGSATDNCGIDSTSFTLISETSDGMSCPGIVLRTYQIADENGNTATCEQDIVIFDTIAPVIVGSISATTVHGCSASDAPEAETSVAGLEALAGGITITDDCTANGMLVVTSNETTEGTCPIVITRTYTVTDACNNSAYIVHAFNVADTIDPAFDAFPGNLTAVCDISEHPAYADYATFEAAGGSASDNCAIDVASFTLESEVSDGESDPLTITRTYTIADFCGNTGTDVQEIVVTDNELPVIACSPDIVQSSDPGSCEASVTVTPPLTTDNCEIKTVTNDFNGLADAGGIYPVGTTMVTWTISDQVGNTNFCVQNITITDDEEPEIICPGAITENLDDNCEFILPDYTTLASVSDNCDPDLSITQSPPPGSLLSGSGSVQEIELLALDHVGNESSCRFNITLMDSTPPEAISINDTSLMMQEGILETTIDIPLPLFADNCGVLSVTNNFNGGTDASGIFRYGTTTIVYTVTDINNNIATFNQHVVVGLENGPEHGLVIPEAFSPNEDGLNDRFVILGLEQYPDAELRIFNAHGIEVYSLANYDNSWDGTSYDSTGNGNKLPTGTYYYILYVSQGGSPVKGFVYLRRE